MIHDIKISMRRLLRSPRFSITAVLLLATGIGANVAVFAVVHALLLTPLPYADPDRLVRIWQSNLERGISRSPVSRSDFFDWREHSASFDYIEGFHGTRETIVRFGSGDPEIVRQASGTDGFFEMLGVRPLAGSAANGRPISHAFWQRRFGADPGAIGTTYTIEGFEQYPASIEAVMPQTFDFPAGAESWTVLSFEKSATRDVNVVARLRRGVTFDQARAELDSMAGEQSWRVEMVPLRDTIVGDVRPTLWLLYSAVCLVLTIAVMNVAGLHLARKIEREREMAVRLALGAGVARLARQHLLESVLLTTAGVAIGLGVAVAAMRVILALAPASMPRVQEIAISGGVLAIGAPLWAAVSLVLSALSWPGLRRTAAALTAGGRASGSRRSGRARSALMIGQIAFCVALLLLSAVVVRTFVALQRAPAGFDAAGVLTIQVRQPIVVPGEVVKHYPLRRFARVTRQATEAIDTLPGVESVAGAMQAPLSGLPRQAAYRILERPVEGPYRGKPPVAGAGARRAALHIVTPAYFATLAIPLQAGRSFDERDRLSEAQIDDHDAWRGVGVAMVSDSFARREWPGDGAVGRYLTVDAAEYRSVRIVGVVGDVRTRPGADAQPAIYLPYGEAPRADLTLLVRTSGDPVTLAAALRERMRVFGSDLAAFNIQTLDEIAATALAQPRFSGAVMAGFGIAGVLFTAAGLYSLLSFLVSQRSRELAIRVALGAGSRALQSLVLNRGLGLTAIGAGLGVGGAVAASRLLQSIVPALQTGDWPLAAATIIVVLSVASLASYVPARRAARIDPILALRQE
jgi:putative ABC transport system permease protein